MEQSEARTDAHPAAPTTRSKKAHLSRQRASDHWTVRWAKARELLADEHGTGELIGRLRQHRSRRYDALEPSWRESLAVAIWAYLQHPDKAAVYQQFRAYYQPTETCRGYKPGWVPQPNTGGQPDADPALAFIASAWSSISEDMRAYIVSLLKPVGQ